MYSELQETRNEVKEVKNEVRKTNVAIDHEIKPKISALFDAREVDNDKLNTIDEKVDRVQIDVNNLTMKVVQSDNTIIELKRNMKKVK